MTKFDGEAIEQRGGRSKGNLPTQREQRKEMEKFLKTGRHPGKSLMAHEHTVVPLPERDPHRPHCFFEFRRGKHALGRLLVEVFEDRIPLAARQLLNRCRPGSDGCFQGTTVPKLLPHLGVFILGASPKSGATPFMKQSQTLQHCQAGTVSISFTSAECVVAFDRARTLDDTHQVVGRVHQGEELLQQLNSCPVDLDDKPSPALVISACGITNARGEFETLTGHNKKLTPEQQAKQLQADGEAAQAAVREALHAGLAQNKRAAGPVAQTLSKKARILDEESDSEGSDAEADDAVVV